MGTVEEVQQQDHDTQVQLHLVREAAKDDAFHPTLTSALDLRRHVHAAIDEVDQELALLRRTRRKLAEMEQEASESARSRAGAPGAAPLAFLPIQAGQEGSGAPSREPGTGYVPPPDLPAHLRKAYQGEIRVGDVSVMPKTEQALVYRRAAHRRGP